MIRRLLIQSNAFMLQDSRDCLRHDVRCTVRNLTQVTWVTGSQPHWHESLSLTGHSDKRFSWRDGLQSQSETLLDDEVDVFAANFGIIPNQIWMEKIRKILGKFNEFESGSPLERLSRSLTRRLKVAVKADLGSKLRSSKSKGSKAQKLRSQKVRFFCT